MFLLSLTEAPPCTVPSCEDLDMLRVYRLYDFTKARLTRPIVAYCATGKVTCAAKLYLVIDSVRPDTKHGKSSTIPAPADGVGGSIID
jgi:hypothetical protein